MKLLIVDCNMDPKCWGAGDLTPYFTQEGVDLFVRRAPHSDLPKNPFQFDKIVITGSYTSINEDQPWITQLEEFTRQIIQRPIPTLGICFGHQMLARSTAGMDFVRKSPVREFGWTEITQSQPNALLKGLPNTFYSFNSHYDEIYPLPSDFDILAHSPACATQAVQMRGKPIFGVQFHPERDLPGAEEVYQDEKKKKQHHDFLRPKEGKKLYKKEIALKIFGNFIGMA